MIIDFGGKPLDKFENNDFQKTSVVKEEAAKKIGYFNSSEDIGINIILIFLNDKKMKLMFYFQVKNNNNQNESA